MATEGPTPFENDVAIDLLERLEGLASDEVCEQLDDVVATAESTHGNEIEIVDGQALVAVATIAAVHCGNDLPEEVVADDLVEQIRALDLELDELADLIERLPPLLAAVADPSVSELARYWADEDEDWRVVVMQLRGVLARQD